MTTLNSTTTLEMQEFTLKDIKGQGEILFKKNDVDEYNEVDDVLWLTYPDKSCCGKILDSGHFEAVQSFTKSNKDTITLLGTGYNIILSKIISEVFTVKVSIISHTPLEIIVVGE